MIESFLKKYGKESFWQEKNSISSWFIHSFTQSGFRRTKKTQKIYFEKNSKKILLIEILMDWIPPAFSEKF